MNYDAAYQLINASVLPAWAMLIALPRARVTQTVVHSGAYPLLLGGFYTICLGLSLFFGFRNDEASFLSLAGVMALFDHPMGVLIGWSHYLVFDLFVGAWIGRDAQRRSIPHGLAAPAMLLAFVFGPIGLTVYLLGRAFFAKAGFSLRETL